MNFLNDKNELVPKGIQQILEERGLWPAKKLNLSCLKPKCLNCQVSAECKICVKGHKCNTCKGPQQCSSTNCYNNWRCDACVHKEEICQYVSKKYFAMYIGQKGKCGDYKDLPPKYTTNDNNLLIRLLSLLIYLFNLLCQASSFNSAWFSSPKLWNEGVYYFFN